MQGLTEFPADGKPRVKVAKELSEHQNREKRLRSTLTHEYGHVKCHAPLYDVESPPSLFPELYEQCTSPRCHRDTILGTGTPDWLEWQAGYISGALLMPRTHLDRIVDDARLQLGIYGAAHTDSPKGGSFIFSVAEAFNTSRDAARVRLQQLGYLVGGSREPSPLHRFSC